MAYADGNIIIGTSVDMYGMNTGLKKIEKSMKKLQMTLGATLGISGLAQLSKQAIDAASDLQEVQNIVDVTFEDMNWKVEKFSETCIDKFGMSELAAKQTAGSFMAMGRSMDLTSEEASNMAIRLTALTGDFASFYNISQDYARVALSAVYTGETETLKRYGIILTEANLQEYASTLGIKEKVKAMSAREKLLLRYNYVMQATNFIEGDFVRTQDSWANQTRVLQQRWKQLMITLGNGLVTILTPMVKVLNQIVVALIRFANVVGQILSRLFGLSFRGLTDELDESAEGAAGSVDDLGDAEEDLADKTDKATKAAKKQLAPFDELNNLMEKNTDSAGDLGDSLGGDLLDDLGDLVSGGKKIDFKLPDIGSLFDLGRWLSQQLSEMLENIDWEKIFEKARRFGTGLADFLNGLITPRLFSNLGKTIANALNTALYAALAFGERFNWVNFGRSLAAGLNSFFLTFDFESLARAINVWVKGLLTTIIKFLDDVDWYMIGERIGTLISKIDWAGILGKAFVAITKAMSAIGDIFTGAFSKAPFEVFSLGLLAVVKVATSNKFSQMLNALTLFGKVAGGVGGKELKKATKQLNNLSPALASVAKVVDKVKTALGTSTGPISFLKNFTSLLSPLAKGLITVAAVAGEFIVVFSSVKDIVKDINDGVAAIDIFKEHIVALTAAIGIAAAALTLIFGFPAGLIIAGITAAVAAVAGFVTEINKINANAVNDAFAEMVNNAEGATHSLADYVNVFTGYTDSFTQGIDDVNKSFENLDKARDEVNQTTDKISTIHLAMQSEVGLTEIEVNNLGEALEGVETEMTELVSAFYDTVIAQAKADYMYLVSTQEYSEELKNEYIERIAILMQNKQVAVDSASAAADAEKTAYAEYSAALDAYNAALSNASTTQAELDAKSAELQEKQTALMGTISDGLDVMAQYGANTLEGANQTQELATSLEDLRGGLDLSSQEMQTTDDAVSAISSTLSTMKDKYADTNTELTNLLKDQQDELLNAQKTGDEALAEQAQSSIEITEQKLEDLRGVYKTELEYLGDDIAAMAPGMLQKLSDEYDAKKGTLAGIFLPPKEEWLDKEMNKWIDDIFGESGISGAMNEAWGAIGEDSTLQAQVQSAVDSMFTWVDTDIEIYTGQYVKERKLSQVGQNIVDGIGEGMESEEAKSSLNESIGSVSDGIVDEFKDDLDSHSPAKVMIPEGKNIVDGVNQGIEENQNYTKSYIDAWAKTIETNIKASFSSLDVDLTSVSSSIVKSVSTSATLVMNTTLTKVKTFFTSIKTESEKLNENIKEEWGKFSTWVNTSILIPTKDKFSEWLSYMKNSIINAFKNAWLDVIKTIANEFVKLGSTISTTMQSAMNDVVSSIEDGLNAMNEGFNKTSNNMKNLSSGSSIKNVTIPRLAKGGVIPANKPFMAMLGDQKSGTNVEAPLETIKQALVDALNSANLNSGDIVLQIDGYEIFRAVRNQSDMFKSSAGYGVL